MKADACIFPDAYTPSHSANKRKAPDTQADFTAAVQQQMHVTHPVPLHRDPALAASIALSLSLPAPHLALQTLQAAGRPPPGFGMVRQPAVMQQQQISQGLGRAGQPVTQQQQQISQGLGMAAVTRQQAQGGADQQSRLSTEEVGVWEGAGMLVKGDKR